jgi:hypothetical protein
MKKWFNLFFYISIIFLLFYLSRSDILKIPDIKSYNDLTISFFFLISGFTVLIGSWYKTLKHSNFKITFKDAFLSVGLSIYGKYMPGKIWLLLGRAGFINKKYNYNLKQLGSYSLYNQIISIWTGILLGFFILFFNNSNLLYVQFFLLLLFLLPLGFNKKFISFSEKFLQKILKRNVLLPYLPFNKLIKLLPLFIMDWLLRGIGLYFLIKSILPSETDFIMILFLPIAGIIGILSVIAPGGIGVREGVLTSLLLKEGLTISDATTIAVFSRLWFLSGETFIFIFSLVWKNYKLKTTGKIKYNNEF